MRLAHVGMGLMVLPLVMCSIGCEDDSPQPPAPTPGGGFTIETVYSPDAGVTLEVVPYIEVNLTYKAPLGSGAAGNGSPQTVITGSADSTRPGWGSCTGCLAPAVWSYQWANQALPPWVPSQCLSVVGTINIEYAGDSDYTGCQYIGTVFFGSGLTMTPSTINLTHPPSTVTVTGAPPGSFKQITGMPQTQYIDDGGVLQGIASATTISSDGTTISGPTPSLSSVVDGQFTGLGGNVAGSSFAVVGAGSVNVISSPPKCCVNGVCSC
jgi:hypothetical protein